ncbi:cytidine deaminase [Aeromicrobium sp.]
MSQSPEDAKLITLARSSRARIGAHDGAAVRDLDGRTYAATRVSLDSLTIDALSLAVAMAVSSGAKGLEAGAVVSNRPDQEIVDLAALRDLAGSGVPVFVADASGAVISVHES